MKIIKNYFYNLSFQILAIIIPFITTPYISRVLHTTGIGQYALSQAIAEYFALIGMLGISIYGMREIAYVRDNKEKMSQVFWEINFMRLITMGTTCVIYGVFVQTITDNKILYIIQSLILAFNYIDISWFYQGIEEFKIIAIRNITVKVIGTILVFTLVKKSTDVILYALIISGSAFIGNVFMWLGIKKYVYFVPPNFHAILHHLKSAFILWIPTIAISIYTYFDKVMLGWLSTEAEVGLYESAQKIVRIITTITTSLSTVMVPQVSNFYIHGELDNIRQSTEKVFSVVSFIAFPLMFGIWGIRKTFVIWFFGKEFYFVSNLLMISGLLILTLSWSSILGKQLLIGCGREKEYTKAVSIGALINILLNFVLINHFASMGAMIASVLAEYIGMLIMMKCCIQSLNIRKIVKDALRYSFVSMIMFLFVFYIGEILAETIVTTIIQIIIGGTIYFGILLISKDKNILSLLKIQKLLSK